MNLKLLVTILFIALTVGLNAQSRFETAYGSVNNDEAVSAIQTMDGGYIMAGYTQSFGAGGQDVYLVKTDATGNVEWTKTYGGAGDDHPASIRQTADSGYFVVGWTSSYGAGSTDFYYLKTDKTGNLLWSKTIGGSSQDIAFSGELTSDGGYIIFGHTTSIGAGYADYYLVKTDMNGDTLWTKVYGGAGDDYGFDVKQTLDGGYIMTGTENTWGAGNFDVMNIKTDGLGNMQWTKIYGGILGDGGTCIWQAPDSGYITVGNTRSFGAGNSDVYLIRSDKNGDTLWTKTYGNTGGDGGNWTVPTDDGNIIVSGTYNSGATAQAYLIETDMNGDTLWTRAFGGDSGETGNSIWQTSDNGFVLCGGTNSYGVGMKNCFLVKMDAAGSSCIDSTVSTIITNPPTIVGSPVPLVTSGGSTLQTNAAVSSGGFLFRICQGENLGIEDAASANTGEIELYPNPTAGSLTLVASRNNMLERAIVYSMDGRVFKSFVLGHTGTTTVDLKDLTGGIYFLDCIGEKVSQMIKVVKY